MWNIYLKNRLPYGGLKPRFCSFSAPEPKAQVHYCDHALSVVRPSVRRLSLTFHIFDFFSKPLNRIQRNLTGSKISTSSTNFVFWGDWKNKMAALTSDWLKHFGLLLWNRWTEFNENWKEARSQRPLPSLFFQADRKNKMAALTSDWLRHFRLLLWNHWMEFKQKMTGSRFSTSSTKFVFFGADQ